MSNVDDRAHRAAARRLASRALAEQGGAFSGGLVSTEDDLPPVGRTVEERILMLRRASEIGHALSRAGRERLERTDWPGRVLRRSD